MLMSNTEQHIVVNKELVTPFVSTVVKHQNTSYYITKILNPIMTWSLPSQVKLTGKVQN